MTPTNSEIGPEQAADALGDIAQSQAKIAARATIPWWYYVGAGLFVWTGQVLPFYDSLWAILVFELVVVGWLLVLWAGHRRMRLVIAQQIPRRAAIALIACSAMLGALFLGTFVVEHATTFPDLWVRTVMGGAMALVIVAFGVHTNTWIRRPGGGVVHR